MRRSTVLSIFLAALGTAVVPAATAMPQAPDGEKAPATNATIEAGQVLTRAFLDGDLSAVHARFDERMQAAMDAAALAAFREQVGARLGEEQAVISEEAVSVQGLESYVRISRWSKLPAPILTQWVFATDGRVAGFLIRPADAQPQAAESPLLQRDTIAELSLPFDGEWYVFWGGRDIEQNYHAANPGQRFAYDFVQHVDGRSHSGDGSELVQYHCWDEPILAPTDGTVVEVVGDLPDQAIGTTNARQPAGNHVILDLGHGEYALLAHLRQGSVAVEAGQQVAAGDELGRCGNSGNTSEPHLHFHLQDSPVFGEGLGLPAFFNDYVADGEPVERGEPVKGEVVRAD